MVVLSGGLENGLGALRREPYSNRGWFCLRCRHGTVRYMGMITLYLPTELYLALCHTARRSGRSHEEIIREAIQVYLRDQERPVLRSVGSGDTGSLHAEKTESWLEANFPPA
jgi:hypothetical protein